MLERVAESGQTYPPTSWRCGQAAHINTGVRKWRGPRSVVAWSRPGGMMNCAVVGRVSLPCAAPAIQWLASLQCLHDMAAGRSGSSCCAIPRWCGRTRCWASALMRAWSWSAWWDAARRCSTRAAGCCARQWWRCSGWPISHCSRWAWAWAWACCCEQRSYRATPRHAMPRRSQRMHAGRAGRAGGLHAYGACHMPHATCRNGHGHSRLPLLAMHPSSMVAARYHARKEGREGGEPP